MSAEAWGDGDDMPEGYVTDDRADEMVQDALAELASSMKKFAPDLVDELASRFTDADAATGDFYKFLRTGEPMPQARPQQRLYPTTITPELTEVLGLMIFATAPIVHIFRKAGFDIPNKAEAEQAFILHWLIGCVLENGIHWRQVSADRLEELMKQIRAKGDSSVVDG